MTNPEACEQNLVNPAAGQYVDPDKYYSFQELPKEIQERLLNLQRGGSNLLKISLDNLGTKIFFLVSTIFLFFLFLIVCSGGKVIFFSGFVGGSLVFLMWIGFFVWKLYQTFHLPIKNNVYLTPTQIIEIKKGRVRYRSIIDVTVIHLYLARRSGSHRLTLEFKTGDSFRFSFPLGWLTGQWSEPKKWQAMAAHWQKCAVEARQCGDQAYFNSWNVFRNLESANVPVRKKTSNLLPVSLLLLMTLAVPAVSAAVIGIASDRVDEFKKWNAAVNGNTAAAYQKYLKDNQRASHRDEAAQKINAFYDAEIKKIGETRGNASDRQGAEALLNLLENARARNNSEIQFQVSSGVPELNQDELKKQIAGSFNKIFPDETLFIKDSGKYFGLTTEPSIDIYVDRPAEPTKSPAKAARANPPGAAPAGQYSFNCTIKVPDKPAYYFQTKVASADEFNRELARHLGLAAPAGDD